MCQLFGQMFLKYVKKMNLEYDMAENILPLPIDQRYGSDDMSYILEILKSIMEE